MGHLYLDRSSFNTLSFALHTLLLRGEILGKVDPLPDPLWYFLILTQQGACRSS